MSQFRLLDLFCGAGGCGVGYSRAGFDVVGVDKEPMKRYPFEFHQGDALEYLVEHGHEFDAIHSSPPCQAYCSLKSMPNAKVHADLVAPTRELLKASGKPWVIENVVGAPLINPRMLCGTMFGLGTGNADLRRHRLFETNWPFIIPFGMVCDHGNRSISVHDSSGRGHDEGEQHRRRRQRKTITVTGSHGDAGLSIVRQMKRPNTVGVWGNAGETSERDGLIYFSTEERNEAMGIDWMKGGEISQAIPPAYTEFIGKQLIGYLLGDAV